MARQRKTAKSSRATERSEGNEREAEVRIVGGQFRGRRLRYHGDQVVRPMKHRTREAIFNLISTDVKGRHAIDLFSGTGALGLEALSRGAVSATFIEKHVPSSRIVAENIRTLDVDDRAKLHVTRAFLWAKRDLGANTSATPPTDRAWLVFCSPPYAFFIDRRDEMLGLLKRIQEHAPAESLLVVEADERFDFGLLNFEATGNEEAAWDIRPYSPAVVGIWHQKLPLTFRTGPAT